jgi:hypothetical protein
MRNSGSKLSLKTLATAGVRIQTGLASLANHAVGANEGFGHWAGSKLRRGSPNEQTRGTDRITLFPGWASREYRLSQDAERESMSRQNLHQFPSHLHPENTN